MSNIHGADTVGNVDQDDEDPQGPSWTSAIGLTYVPTNENSTLRGILNEAEGQVILRALQHTGWKMCIRDSQQRSVRTLPISVSA